MKKNNGMLFISMETPNRTGNDIINWCYWLQLTSWPTNQRNIHELITPSLNKDFALLYFTPNNPLQVRAHRLRTLVCHDPLCLVCVLSCFSYVQLFATLWTVVHQAPPFRGFSRQEYWSRLSFPFLGDLPDPRIERAHLMSPELAGMYFTTSITWEALGKAIKLFSTSSKTVSKIWFGIGVPRPNSASLRVIRLLHCV